MFYTQTYLFNLCNINNRNIFLFYFILFYFILFYLIITNVYNDGNVYILLYYNIYTNFNSKGLNQNDILYFTVF